VANDKIVFIPLLSAAASFAFLKACSTYFITAKQFSADLNIFRISDLLLAKRVDCGFLQVHMLTIEKDTLIVGG
jgi:hypothetical protein